VAVAFVLIPQCLAYAELAGMPAHRGLLAAAVPPILAALFASSPYLQTGPVALTSLLVLVALNGKAPLATDQYVLLGILLAAIVGAVRVAISLLRAGRLAHILSQPVLRGFVLGAAWLIVCSQLPSALGSSTAGRGLLGEALWTLSHPGGWELEASVLSGLAIALILGVRRFYSRFPGVLVAMVGGLTYSISTGYEGLRVGAIEQGSWGLPGALPWDAALGLIVPGIIIAFVAFGEALSISQSFAEEDRQPWDANQEFMSQGVANLASAAVGSFPVGGSFSRSSLNRLAGARSRWSGAVTGLTVLLFLPFSGVIEQLPKALLGATVIAAISPLLSPRRVLDLFAGGKARGGVGLSTFVMTVVAAPRIEIAVILGAVLALLADWRKGGQISVQRRPDGGLSAQGYLCFLTVGGFGRALRRVATEGDSASPLLLDVSGLEGLDITGRGLLDDVLLRLSRRGIRITQAGTT
jgi:SulP family sulfate permease